MQLDRNDQSQRKVRAMGYWIAEILESGATFCYFLISSVHNSLGVHES